MRSICAAPLVPDDQHRKLVGGHVYRPTKDVVDGGRGESLVAMSHERVPTQLTSAPHTEGAPWTIPEMTHFLRRKICPCHQGPRRSAAPFGVVMAPTATPNRAHLRQMVVGSVQPPGPQKRNTCNGVQVLGSRMTGHTASQPSRLHAPHTDGFRRPRKDGSLSIAVNIHHFPRIPRASMGVKHPVVGERDAFLASVRAEYLNEVSPTGTP